MYELIQAAGGTYYVQCPAKIGIVRTGGDEVCLIDSGSSRDAARKVRQILEGKGWALRAIFNTHSNADHIGGNCYLQERTGCAVYAPGIERDLTAHPLLEPSFLWGGYPCAELRHKFLMAEPSDARELTDGALPDGMTAVALPGHFFSMTGFRTADDVVFLADCLAGKATLEKYGITFVYDVAAYLDTLEKVKAMEARLFVPSHAEATEDIAPLAQLNIDRTHEIAERILALCRMPRSFESVLQGLFSGYGLSMTFDQYALAGSTVRSYLSWLKDAGLLSAAFEDNVLLWERLG